MRKKTKKPAPTPRPKTPPEAPDYGEEVDDDLAQIENEDPDRRGYIDDRINEALANVERMAAVVPSRELAMVRTKLQEAGLWLGEVTCRR